MLSVAESARILHVSPARVRALIADGALPARKIGHAWTLRSEDVMKRVERHPRSGRPKKPAEHQRDTQDAPAGQPAATALHANLHELYAACKDAFAVRPDAAALQTAASSEETSFYLAVSDFFLQQKQDDLIKRNVF